MRRFSPAFYPLLFIVITALMSLSTIDPDFGWHYKMGELILLTGIPATDPFSYTMSSFPFVDHEWLTNVGMYVIQNTFGHWGLGILFSTLAIGALVIVLWPLKKAPAFFLVLFGTLLFLPHLGIRPQIISWFLFAILLRLMLSERLWKRYRWGIPFLMVFWVNLHGGFAIALVALGVMVLASFFNPRRLGTLYSNVPVLVLATLASLVNPYGWRVFEEVWRQVSDVHLLTSISEWTPTGTTINLFLVFSIGVAGGIFVFFWRQWQLYEKLLFIGLFVAMMVSNRHTPLWALFALYIINKGFTLLFSRVQSNSIVTRRLRHGMGWVAVVGAILFLSNFISFGDNDTEPSQPYPYQAVSFLKENPSVGNIFNEYGWGGHLILTLPEKKVFIDGRMPSWRRNNPPPRESAWAFREYVQVTNGTQSFEASAATYGIDTVLIKPDNAFEEKLRQNGWTRVFSDSTAVVYRKVKSTLSN